MTVADPVKIRLTQYIPQDHVDHLNEKQHAALWINQREVLYGGAAGGGKSDYLLMAALQYVDVPDYHAIIFRRTHTDLALPGALMDRAHNWLDDTDARWSDQGDPPKTWVFPSGAKLSFGYLKRALDKYRYQSTDFQFIGFDELTQFPEDDYTYLFSRLRGPASGPLSRVPLRMRAGSNPGGVGHNWVKKRFIDEHKKGRIFVPARLYDNAENINVSTYEESLSELDEQTRKQLLDGDWTVRPAGDWYFDHEAIEEAKDLAHTLYDAALRADDPIPPAGGVVHLGIDWGESTQAYTIWPLERGGVYVPPAEVVAIGGEPSESARRMLVAGSKFEYPLASARYDAAGVQSMRTFVKVARLSHWPALKSVKIPFSKYKGETATYLRRLFERTAMQETTQRIAISPHNQELCRQLPELKVDPENPSGAWLKEDDQHGPDALLAGVAPIAKRNRLLVGQTNG